MIIKKLTMKNFGVYAGENSFVFSHSKPIVLIGGMNGRGKTTFLEAILLALYGSNSAAYRESHYRTYGRYLRSYINKTNENKGASVELSFVMNESSLDEFRIHREWNSLSKNTSESITVFKNGVYDDFLTKNWPMFVENILPSALSKFFFFDGEKIAELAVDDTGSQMKESIRAMLGIGVLDVLKNDLSKSLKTLTKKDGQKDIDDALDTLRRDKENLESSLSDFDAEMEQTAVLIGKQQAVIDDLRHQYEIKGGDVIEQRQSLMQQRSNLLAEIEQNKNTLVECAATELPLYQVKDLIGNIKLQAEDEHNDLIMQQSIGLIENILAEYSKDHGESLKENSEFVSYVRKKTTDCATDAFYQISDHALFQLNSLLESILDQSVEYTKQLLKQKDELKQKLDEIDSYLTLDINESALGNLFDKIREQEAILVKLKVHLTELEQQRSSANGKLIIVTAEYNKAIDSFLQNAELRDDNERMAKYTNLALKITEEYSVALQKEKTRTLGDTITECYKKLANKKNLINLITIDPETLDIIYLDSKNDEVPKESLSAGEKQLMVIAILWALAICSKKKLPVIIDTPLSRLDSLHRQSLVTSYFPYASDQTIILSTDSEIDHHYYELMKDAVGDEFTLNYDEETKSTTILKGYFQENDN